MNKRLMKIRKSEGLNQQDFGERIGLSKASISALENGTREITDRTVLLISKEYGINETWFKTGEGDMYLATDIAYNMGSFIASAPVEHQELINAIMKLSDQTKDELIVMMRNIINNIDK